MSNKKSNHQKKQEEQQSLLSRLKRAVQKVRFLLSSTIISRTWNAVSLIRASSSLSQGRLSFNDDRTGLKICSSEDNETDSSEGSDSRGRELQRTISYPSADEADDINKRAEMFIANFRKQLRMERQISLQLRYQREQSFDLISP